ncbi:MAG TPA: hypothetical protein VFO01_18980 [Trebonia sp.]|nr:hypothetical protein [Trebonia sp.]
MTPGGTGHWGRLLRAGAPMALAVLTALHPAYSTDAGHEAARIAADGMWLPLHLALLAAFALYGISLLTWPTAGGRWWQARRAGVVLSLVCYSAFLGVDGIAGGLLARASASAPAGLRPGLDLGVTTLFSQGVVGVLALLGAAGWVIATVAITVESAADVRLLVPAAMLVASGVLLGFSHDPPVGPLGAGLAVTAAVLADATLYRRFRPLRARAADQSAQDSPTGSAVDTA